MTSFSLRPVLLVLGALAILASPALSQRGAIGRELLDAARRFAGREAAERGSAEVLETGTEVLARRVAEKLGRDGGEVLLARAARLTDDFGPRALRTLDDAPNPARLLDDLDALPAPSRSSALAAFEREGAALHEAYAAVGSAALRAELRHPGVGAKLAAGLGEDAARVLDDLPSADVAVLARYADDAAALPVAARSEFAGAVSRNAKAVAEYLRKHPGFTLTVAGVSILAIESDRAAEGLSAAIETGAEAAGGVAKILATWVAPVLALFLGLSLWRRSQRTKTQAS